MARGGIGTGARPHLAQANFVCVLLGLSLGDSVGETPGHVRRAVGLLKRLGARQLVLEAYL